MSIGVIVAIVIVVVLLIAFAILLPRMREPRAGARESGRAGR